LPAGEKLSHDGYVALTGRYQYNENFPELFVQGKLELKLAIKPGVLVGADLFARTDRTGIRIRELFILFPGNPNLKIGNPKKYLGLEELIAEEERLTIEPSQVNRRLADFGYVGRSPGILVYQGPGAVPGPYAYYLSLTYNQAASLDLNGRLARCVGPSGGQAGLNGIVKAATPHIFFRDYDYEYPELTYALSLDFTKDAKAGYADIETFFGLDPYETQLSEFTGAEREVLFAALKGLIARRFDTNRNLVRAVEPLLLASFLIPDLDEEQVNRIEAMAGINFYFDDKLRLRLNGSLVFANSLADPGRRSIGADSRAGAEFQVRW
jgi:hypothetical protein